MYAMRGGGLLGDSSLECSSDGSGLGEGIGPNATFIGSVKVNEVLLVPWDIRLGCSYPRPGTVKANTCRSSG